MKKRAIAYIGGPRQLQDFLWYYLAYGKEYTWDLVCQPMNEQMRLDEICMKTGLFEKIFSPPPFLTRSRGQMIKVGMAMSFNWIIGANKRYAKREIEKFAELDKYEHMCLSTTRGVTCGMMALAADNSISIDLMEDGQGDNTDANAKFELKRVREPFYLVSYAFAKMGYCNPSGMFPLKSTKKCRRFSAKPELLSKELYKEVLPLYDMTLVNADEYQELVNKTFGDIQKFSDADAILFSTNMKDFTTDDEHYEKLVCEYISEQGYNKVAIKKHPRDIREYDRISCEIEVFDKRIPGERIVEMIENQKIYFMYPSTTCEAFANKEKEITIFKFRELSEDLYYKSHFENSYLQTMSIPGINLTIVEL